MYGSALVGGVLVVTTSDEGIVIEINSEKYSGAFRKHFQSKYFHTFTNNQTCYIPLLGFIVEKEIKQPYREFGEDGFTIWFSRG